MLLVRTTGAAVRIEEKLKPCGSGMCAGVAVWEDLEKKYMPSDESYCRALLRQLDSMSMAEGTDPDIFISDVWELTYRMEDINEPVSKAKTKDVIVTGLLSSSEASQLQDEMYPELDLGIIENTARSMFGHRNRKLDEKRA